MRAVLMGFVMTVTVTAAAGVPTGIFVLVMFVMSVCLMSMFVMSAAAFLVLMFMLVPVFSAGNAVPRLEFHLRTAHGFAAQS